MDEQRRQDFHLLGVAVAVSCPECELLVGRGMCYTDLCAQEVPVSGCDRRVAIGWP